MSGASHAGFPLHRKTGKPVKSNSRWKTQGIKKFWQNRNLKILEINREFRESLKRPSQNEGNRIRKLLCDVNGLKFEFASAVILLQKYTGKTEIPQGKHRYLYFRK